jgi:Xaa-Pro dipeptidase
MASAPLDRLEQVRKQLHEHQLDCLALVPGFNLRYITGIDFMLLERPIIVFIPSKASESPVVVIPELEAANWRHLAPFEAQLFPWTDQAGPDDAMRQAAHTLHGVRTLGVEHLRMRVLEADLIGRFMPEIRVLKGETVLNPLRLHKGELELASHRKAVRVCEAALEEVVSNLSPGETERQICSRLTSVILKHGGESTPIEALVLSGPNSGSPHGRSSERQVARGDILLFDFVTTVNGYYADITRTFVVGRKPNERMVSVYNAVKAANAAGRAAVKPGVTCQDVDRAARQVLVNAGLGPNFTHRTGHGLGLDVHEEPGIVEGNEMRLEEGMVFTIEPGSYIEGWGGVRIEDDVVVTKTGYECLTTFDRELRIIGDKKLA